MPSLLPGYQYDIFISYRQKDNKYDGWVTEFVANLKKELEATFKEDISIYFDSNPHDGLLETHDVDDSLRDKLRCLVFIPILSQTYCDPNGFAWKNEFLAFKRAAEADPPGLKVRLASGNVASRILPVRIHELDPADKETIEAAIGPIRAIDFIFKSSGVNRPLRSQEEHPQDNLLKTYYRDQVNKVANSVKELLAGMRSPARQQLHAQPSKDPDVARDSLIRTALRKNQVPIAIIATLLLVAAVYFFMKARQFFPGKENAADNSIAVLPFKNMSAQAENQHVCDGVMEAILNHLAKLKDLHVTSRTSVEKYREAPPTVRVIGEELGVAHILEGSVQRSGGKLKVTAQLIEAATDRHLWSEEFVSDETDLFALQSEIARRIADVLNVTLSRQEKELISRVPTQNLEAWNLYLQAQAMYAHYSYSGRKEEDYQHLMQLCNQALRLDPQLAEAYTLKAEAYTWARYYQELYSENFMDSAAAWCRQALELDPGSSSAHWIIGYYFLNTGQQDLAGDHFEKALSFGPNNIEAHQAAAFYYRTQQDFERSFSLLDKGFRLAPGSVWLPWLYLEYSQQYHDICDFEACLGAINKAVELEPGVRWNNMTGWVYIVTGQKEKAKTWCESAVEAGSPWGLFNLGGYYAYFEPEKALPVQEEFHRKDPDLANQPGSGHRYAHALWAAGRREDAMKEFKKAEEYLLKSLELGRSRFANYYDLAGIQCFLGNTDKALEYLHEYDGKDWPGSLTYFVEVDPMFDNLRSNPEFVQMVKSAQERKAEIRARIKSLGLGLPGI
jgi:TolB-like protein